MAFQQVEELLVQFVRLRFSVHGPITGITPASATERFFVRKKHLTHRELSDKSVPVGQPLGLGTADGLREAVADKDEEKLRLVEGLLVCGPPGQAEPFLHHALMQQCLFPDE